MNNSETLQYTYNEIQERSYNMLEVKTKGKNNKPIKIIFEQEN